MHTYLIKGGRFLKRTLLPVLLILCLTLGACGNAAPDQAESTAEESSSVEAAGSASSYDRTKGDKALGEEEETSEEVLPETEESSEEKELTPEEAAALEAAKQPAKTTPPEAVELTSSMDFYADETIYDWEWENMLDADYDTYCHIEYNTSITLTSDTPIAGVYLVFHFAPGEWTVEAEGQEILCGQNDFIHEYVPIPVPAKEVTLNIPWDTYLCDIYTFGQGTLPEWVQVWTPPCDQADIACFPTHSDDELLFFGGVIPYYAGELGLKVQVIYLTYHDLPRPHELLNGLWTCGDNIYPVIGPFYDEYCNDLWDAMTVYSEWSWVEFEVEMLRRFKPSVIVCHDEEGEYGHGAHCLNTYCMEQAVELACDPDEFTDSYEEYGTWDVPKMYIHLYEENQITMDWHVPLSRFGGRTALDMAIAGYDCHLSQHQYSFAVLEEGYGDCRLFGLYRTTVGYDTTADMMENINYRN